MGISNDFKRAVKEVVYGSQAEASEPKPAPQAAVAKKNTQEATLPAAKKTEAPAPAPEVIPRTVGTTVIASGTVIHGFIETLDMVEVNGELIGDITCKASVSVSGKIQGNITAEQVKLKDAVIQGNIQSQKFINISQGTQVMGDLQAEELIAEGRIKGNITAKGLVTAGEKSVIVGDINAGELELKRGAYIEGNITLTNMAMEQDKYFDKFTPTKKV